MKITFCHFITHRLVTALIVGTVGNYVHAAGDDNCSKILTLKGSQTIPAAKIRINLQKLSSVIIQYVEKEQRAPSVEDLVLLSGLTLTQLTEYFDKESSPNIIDIIESYRPKKSEIFQKMEHAYASQALRFFKKNYELPSDSQMAQHFDISVAELRTLYGAYKGALQRIREYENVGLRQFENKILAAYAKVAKELGRTPTLDEVSYEFNQPKERLARLMGKNKIFDKYEDLFALAADAYPNAFRDVQNTNVFTHERLERALSAMRSGERLIITSAVAGVELHAGFLSALKNYSKQNNAAVFVRPVNLRTNGLQRDLLDSDFIHVVINTIHLSPTLVLSNLKLLPTMLNPLTGLNKFWQGQTVFVGHIQRRLQTKASVNSALEPVFSISTGAINKNQYVGGKYVRERVAEFASRNHFTGAFILEKTSARKGAINLPGMGRFHIRFIEYVHEIKTKSDARPRPLENPYFLDLDNMYFADGTIKSTRLQALLFGDLHFGATDQRAFLKAKIQLVNRLKPYVIFTEDDYDGREINHHVRDKAITRSVMHQMLSKWGVSSLEEGLHFLRSNLEALLSATPGDSVIVRKRSNHPHWVERYLQSGAFMEDPANTIIGLELATALANGMDPIDYFLKKHMSPENYKRVKTLQAGEAIFEGLREVLVSQHGDKGVNGAKGSMNAFIESTNAAVFGHTHMAEVFNRIVNMPGLPAVPQDYAKEGFSKALIGNAGIGPNGEIQLYLYDPYAGEYFRDNNIPLADPDTFFHPDCPYAEPTYDPTAENESERLQGRPGADDGGQYR